MWRCIAQSRGPDHEPKSGLWDYHSTWQWYSQINFNSKHIMCWQIKAYIFLELTSLPCGASPASKALQGVKVMPSLEPCNVHTAGRGEAPERSVREVTVNLCMHVWNKKPIAADQNSDCMQIFDRAWKTESAVSHKLRLLTSWRPCSNSGLRLACYVCVNAVIYLSQV